MKLINFKNGVFYMILERVLRHKKSPFKKAERAKYLESYYELLNSQIRYGMYYSTFLISATNF